MSNTDDRERKILELANNLSGDAKQLEEVREERKKIDKQMRRIEKCLGLPEAPRLPAATKMDAGGIISQGAASLDELLPSDVLLRIERRFDSGFTRKHCLDRWDVLAGCFCGVIGGAIDFFLVGLPKDVMYLGELPQKAGPLPKLLKRWKVSDDNFLAKIARVPYDKSSVPGARISGMHPRNHRLLTPGHDPLVGAVVGVFDIIRGGRTALDVTGIPHFHSGFSENVLNPITACVIWLLHLFSDVATPMGVPPPGWSLTQLLQIGAFGNKDRTVADLAHYMYLNGYDFRHFVASASSVAAIELTLSAYFGGRRFFDREYELDCRADTPLEKNFRHHPRYRAMRFIADAVACGANAGKIAVYAGNPLAFNYAQWLALLRSASGFLADLLESPTNVLCNKAAANKAILEDNWNQLYEQVLRSTLRSV